MHCALLHAQTAKHHGCNEFVHCCMPRPQSILFHIASVANTRMSLSHSRYLQCYLKIRYIHGALRPGYATIRNVQCNNSEDNPFLIRCICVYKYVVIIVERWKRRIAESKEHSKQSEQRFQLRFLLVFQF